MALEVSQEGVVVSREVTDAIIDFGAGIDNRGRMMGETSQVGAILLRE